MPGWRRCDPLPQSQLVGKRGLARRGEIAFVASLPANDRISVVQETYKSALIMAKGYGHELLKSEAEMLKAKIQQALGEALLYHHSSCPSHGERPVGISALH